METRPITPQEAYVLMCRVALELSKSPQENYHFNRDSVKTFVRLKTLFGMFDEYRGIVDRQTEEWIAEGRKAAQDILKNGIQGGPNG